MGEGLGVSVIGAGYVGLVTAACLTHLGHRVVCVEKEQRRLQGLEEGRLPFYEPGLEELVRRGLRASGPATRWARARLGLLGSATGASGVSRKKKLERRIVLHKREAIADSGRMVGRSFHVRLVSAGRGLWEKALGWGR